MLVTRRIGVVSEMQIALKGDKHLNREKTRAAAPVRHAGNISRFIFFIGETVKL